MLRGNRQEATRKRVAVIGLGRFGSSVARVCHELGYDVTAIDIDEERVAERRTTPPSPRRPMALTRRRCCRWGSIGPRSPSSVRAEHRREHQLRADPEADRRALGHRQGGDRDPRRDPDQGRCRPNRLPRAGSRGPGCPFAGDPASRCLHEPVPDLRCRSHGSSPALPWARRLLR